MIWLCGGGDRNAFVKIKIYCAGLLFADVPAFFDLHLSLEEEENQVTNAEISWVEQDRAENFWRVVRTLKKKAIKKVLLKTQHNLFTFDSGMKRKQQK